MFFTLTFPADRAPSEDDAHAALRALTRRLRYRHYLGPYGWVLQRTRRGTLHHHGIAHLPWFDDDRPSGATCCSPAGSAFRTDS